MRLKDYVEITSLNISKLAAATGIPHSTLLSYVNETHEPNLKNALKIEEATLGVVTVQELVLNKK